MSAHAIGELCAGYGGLDMGVSRVIDAEMAWYSEIDKGALKVLNHRFPDVPNIGDMTAVDWADVPPVDILTGGTPCQDLSHAGKRAGMTEGTRSNLWVAMREAIAVLRPSLVVWENVGGAYSAAADSDLEQREGRLGDGPGRPALRALGRVLGDLASLGYVGGWHGLRAADVGAPHGRLRVFVVAYPKGNAGWLEHGDCAVAADHHNEGRRGIGWLDRKRRDPDGRRGADELRSTDERPSLLPTPRATDGTKGGPSQRGSSGDLMLPSAVTLLPTPVSQEPGGTLEQYHARFKDGRESTFAPLSMAVQMLPTPSVADVEGGRKSRSGERSDELLLNGIASEQRWGDYTDAIARWEHLTRPAPEPTMPSRRGTPQLSPAFSEWMMGLPAGWVADAPGITRNEALRALGNGVVPQQAAAAVSFLLGVLSERVAA